MPSTNRRSCKSPEDIIYNNYLYFVRGNITSRDAVTFNKQTLLGIIAEPGSLSDTQQSALEQSILQYPHDTLITAQEYLHVNSERISRLKDRQASDVTDTESARFIPSSSR